MKKYIFGAVIALGLVVSPAFTYAGGLTDTQVQAILSLLSSFGADSATIANVNAALTGTPTTGGGTSGGGQFCYNFNSNLTFGSTNQSDLDGLRTVLNKEGLLSLDKDVFTEDTAAAVVQFQAKYGISQTGYVGPITRAKLNSLYRCSVVQPPAPQNPTTPTSSTVVDLVKNKLATKLGISTSAITLVSIDRQQWSSGCLGVDPGPGFACTQSFVDGYDVVISANGQNYDYHTNSDGSQIVEAPSNTTAPAISAPTVTLSASKTTITSGQSVSIGFQTTNATSCTGSGGWSGAYDSPLSGSSVNFNPTQTTTYTLTCAGPGGSATQSVTVTVVASIPAPTATITSSVSVPSSTPFTISGTTSLSPGSYIYLEYGNGGGSGAAIVQSNGSWRFDYQASGGLLAGSYPITLRSYSAVGSIIGTGTLTVAVAPAPVTITSPSGGQTLTAGQPFSVTWKGGTATNVWLGLFNWATKTESNNGEALRVNNGSASYTIDAAIPAGQYFIRVEEASGGGGTHSDSAAVNIVAPITPTVALSVAKSGTGSGTVTSSNYPTQINCGSTCSSSFTANLAPMLVATPATGSTFAGWSGDACASGTGGTNAVCRVSMTANKSVTATFTTTPTTSAPTQATLPDLQVTYISPTSVTANQMVPFTATIKNVGPVNITTSFVANINGTTVTVNSLGAGQTTTVSATSGFAVPGSSRFCVMVDTSNSVAESNESNNALCQTVTVTAPSGPITLTSPSGGQTLTAGQSYTVRWTGGASSSVGVYLLNLNGMVVGSGNGTSCPNSGSCSWTVPASTPTGQYLVRVTEYGGGYTHGDSGTVNVIAATPPISITRPNGGETLSDGQTYTITWTGGTAANVDLSLWKWSTKTSAGAIIQSIPNTGSYVWTIPTTVMEGQYFIRVAESGVGNTHSDSASAVNIVVPPQLEWGDMGGGAALNGFNSAVNGLTGNTTVPQSQQQSSFSYVWNNDMQIGSSGADVTALQTALTKEGVYSGEITGGFYNQTYLAVKSFQEKYGIKMSGYVGYLTRTKLNELY